MPLLDRVLVQRIKAETKTAGGIFLPESSVEKLNEARVIAAGPGGLDRDGKRIPMGVSEGDRVLIPQVRRTAQKNARHNMANMVQFGGSPVKVGEEEYTLYRDSEYDEPLKFDSRWLTMSQNTCKDSRFCIST